MVQHEPVLARNTVFASSLLKDNVKQDVVEQPVERLHLGSFKKRTRVCLWPPSSIKIVVYSWPKNLLLVLVVHKTFCLHPENLPNHVLRDDDLVVLPFTNNGASNDLCVALEDGVGVVVPGTMKAESIVPPNLLHKVVILRSLRRC